MQEHKLLREEDPSPNLNLKDTALPVSILDSCCNICPCRCLDIDICKCTVGWDHLKKALPNLNNLPKGLRQTKPKTDKKPIKAHY